MASKNNDGVRVASIGLVGRALDRIASVAKVAIGAWAIVRSIEALAGKITIADLSAKWLTDVGAEADGGWLRWLPWALWLGTGVWAVAERRLRHKTIHRQSREISLLQRTIDPNKQSSGLALNGQTRPEDE